MKILQVNCVFESGSTGKIVYDLHTELQRGNIESLVCYGRGTKVDEPNVYKTCSELYAKFNNLLSRLTGLMYGGCFFSTNKLISIIKRENPDVVHLHCINGYFVNIYRLINFLNQSRIKTVLTLHAEFMHTGNCGYALDCEKWKTGCGHCPRLKEATKSLLLDRTHSSWQRMKRAFEGFNNLIITSVSPWLMVRAKQSPILADKQHLVVLNGIDTEIFHPYDTVALKKKHGLTHEKIIFHATAAFNNDPEHIKGGYYVLELAKQLQEEDVKIFVAGAYDTSIQAPDNLVFLGRIGDQKLLAQYYSMADVTLLTSKKETFSMISAESLCCGTPVVGFKAGGPEMIAISNFSVFVDYADLNALQREMKVMVCRMLDCENISQSAALKYAKSVMAREYVDIYEMILGWT